MSNMVLWPPASVVPENQMPWPEWRRKVSSKSMSDSLSPDHPGWSPQTMRSGRVRVWDLLACIDYLWWNQALIFPGTELWVEAENSKKAWNSRIIIRPAEKKCGNSQVSVERVRWEPSSWGDEIVGLSLLLKMIWRVGPGSRTCVLSHVQLFQDSMDFSPPGSSVHGILQARILKWVPFPPSGDLPDAGMVTSSHVSPGLSGRLFTINHQGSLYSTQVQ